MGCVVNKRKAGARGRAARIHELGLGEPLTVSHRHGDGFK